MRLKSVAFAAAFAVAALLAPRRAAAQEGSWFFCYVDPPTFDSGAYVYTRVNYIGSAAIPQAAIAVAMAADNPQVAERQITCWRYATQAEAEDRRRTGMASDRSRNYSIHEIGWTSPYSPPPAPADTVARSELENPPSAGADSKPEMSAKPAATSDKYARELVEYEKQKAEYARQQAQYARALEDNRQRVGELAVRREQAREQYEQQRAQWKADVEACMAGERSKCAKPQE